MWHVMPVTSTGWVTVLTHWKFSDWFTFRGDVSQLMKLELDIWGQSPQRNHEKNMEIENYECLKLLFT